MDIFVQIYTMLNIILFGKPGSGKGTQAEFIKEKYKLVHISTGDLFRQNIKNQTELGKLAQRYMNNGDLVPDTVTIGMLKSEVESNIDANGFLFDGFPRTVDQAVSLDKFLDKSSLYDSSSGVFFLGKKTQSQLPQKDLIDLYKRMQ